MNWKQKVLNPSSQLGTIKTLTHFLLAECLSVTGACPFLVLTSLEILMPSSPSESTVIGRPIKVELSSPSNVPASLSLPPLSRRGSGIRVNRHVRYQTCQFRVDNRHCRKRNRNSPERLVVPSAIACAGGHHKNFWDELNR
jgi:hypothetical protein